MESTIGIDLGTTFSCVATIKPNGEPEVIGNFDGLNVTPSVVAYPKGTTLVGKSAVRSSAPLEDIIYDSKRFIGRQYNDISVQDDMKLWPFKIINDKGKPFVKLTYNNAEKKLAAEEISAEVLKMMKKIAENYQREEVTKAVITVPAHFDQRQRHSTMKAAELAGIKVIRLVNEPTAAAIAYGVQNQGKKNVLIYDLGGGTFDCSIVKCDGNNRMSVIAIDGHKHLGGQDFDRIIANYALENFENFPRNKPKMMRRLIEVCTEAKITLSCSETATIFVDNPASDDGWELLLSRDKLNQLIGKHLHGTLDIVDQALRAAKMKTTDIDIVILAGGSTRILMVQDLLEKKFGKGKLWNKHNPDEVVAKGAALAAKALTSRSSNSLQLVFNDIVPLSIGQETNGGFMYFAIKRGTEYPCKREKIIELAKDNQKFVCINIYEGERKKCKYNFKIGNIKLNLKNQHRRGDEIKTIYEIDQNGLLHVIMAEDKNGNSASIEIQYDGCPHKDANIEDIVAEAKRNKEEDDEFEILIQTLYEFERQIYHIKHLTKDDKSMSNSDKEKIFQIVNEYLEWDDEIPEPMELYKTKMTEFANKIRKHFPSVDEKIALNKLTKYFQMTNISNSSKSKSEFVHPWS